MSNLKETTVLSVLSKMGACDKALKWVNSFPEGVRIQELWDQCPDSTWMLWFIVRLVRGHCNYHEFIRRTNLRALALDPTNTALASLIEERDEWLATASEEDLKIPINWKEEAGWLHARASVWLPRNHLTLMAEEYTTRANDLRKLFPIRLSIIYKKGYPKFEVKL